MAAYDFFHTAPPPTLDTRIQAWGGSGGRFNDFVFCKSSSGVRGTRNWRMSWQSASGLAAGGVGVAMDTENNDQSFICMEATIGRAINAILYDLPMVPCHVPPGTRTQHVTFQLVVHVVAPDDIRAVIEPHVLALYRAIQEDATGLACIDVKPADTLDAYVLSMTARGLPC